MIYALLSSMIIACILLGIVGYLLIPVFARLVSIRRAYLVPLTLVFAVAGTYVYRSNPMDLMFLMAFGLFGYGARKLDFDVTPLVMGFILTPPMEYAFGQTILMSQGNVADFILTQRPVAVGLMIVIPLVLAFVWWRGRSRRS
ncbi:MAG: tripartite tricarboxylate transporter permease, partial [Rhodospirillales bacterium]